MVHVQRRFSAWIRIYFKQSSAKKLPSFDDLHFSRISDDSNWRRSYTFSSFRSLVNLSTTVQGSSWRFSRRKHNFELIDCPVDYQKAGGWIDGKWHQKLKLLNDEGHKIIIASTTSFPFEIFDWLPKHRFVILSRGISYEDTSTRGNNPKQNHSWSY